MLSAVLALDDQEIARGEARQVGDNAELDSPPGAVAVRVVEQRARRLVVDNPIVGVLRRVSFTPAEVIAVERFYCIPLFYKGVVIHHRKPESECPGSVKFFTMGNLDELTRRIADAGFLLGTPPG